MEIKDNQLLRQFEVQTDSGLLAMEYAIQERKLFLTKLNQPEELEVEYINDFIKMVLESFRHRFLGILFDIYAVAFEWALVRKGTDYHDACWIDKLLGSFEVV